MIVDGGQTKYYYHFDGLGSVVALSNNDGDIVERYSYDVFGEPNRTSDVNNPYMFTGRRYDSETGLYYYRARYYKPSIGRFIQTDPIRYAAGLNLYTYCGNKRRMNFKDINCQNRNHKISKVATASLVCSILGTLFILLIGLCFFKLDEDVLILVLFLLWYPALFLFSLSAIFGIVAIIIIKFRKEVRGLNRAVVSVCLISLGFFALYVFFVKSIPIEHRERCQKILRKLSMAVAAYREDNNGKHPSCATWCDELRGKYVTEEEWFRCPGDKKGPCSYAMNSYVENWNGWDRKPSGKRVLLFESKPGWNQFGGPELLNTDNHEGKGCCVCYVNGGGEFVPADKLGNLRWTDDKNKKEKVDTE